MINPLISNLKSHDTLTLHEEKVLSRLFTRDKRVLVDEDIVLQGSRPPFSTLLLEGISARYRVMEDGSRQITAINIAGDFVDLHAFMVKTMDHGIVALTPCHIAFADHSDLKILTEQEPHLTRLFWLTTVIDAAIHREWIVAMGRRTKKAHLAHLVCELFLRLQVVGLTIGRSFSLPLSQVELADVLGLSVVHLNKTLQGLRKDGVLTWADRTVEIFDWDRLLEIAEFDATYLNLAVEPR
ncbi:Crp/Fnr family transcriptional regulator [Pararhizobium gei]|uniref:Crp/Fnr family transcriptional regulator n=1 Tax=Pararhizobium gei TaxID=1395951 RepID=UPI0023DAF43E|nr:Crp/Fnr family transcriptional regulator [Rhizobium gei]